MKPEVIELPGVETLDLVVRNVDGQGVLFTRDGKLLGYQVAHVGHYYYDGHKSERVTMYRATFVVQDMKPDVPE